MRRQRTLYEIYDKRVLHQETLDGLPLLDRCTEVRRAVKSANTWGGAVVRVQALVTRERPLERQVLSWDVVFVHDPPKPANGTMTVGQLRKAITPPGYKFRRR